MQPNERYELAYAVVRFQISHAHARGHGRGDEVRQRDFAVVKVVRSLATAQQEVERLNSLNRTRGCIYFLQETRLERDALPPLDPMDDLPLPG